MEDDHMTSPLQNPAILLGVAATGALLGLIALIVAIAAKSSATGLEKKVTGHELTITEMATSVSKVNEYSKRIESIDKSNDAISLKLGEIDRNLRTLAEQTQVAINSVNAEIAETRKSVSSGGSRSAASGSKPSADAPVAAGQYKIQKGDTLAVVARQAGVKLDALLEANPDVDPRRLKVGQVINLPK